MKILHQLPGRIRIQLTEEEVDQRLPVELEVLARSLTGVYSANYQPLTKTLLLYFAEVTPFQLWRSLQRQLQPEKNAMQQKAAQAAQALLNAFVTDFYLKKSGYSWLKKLLLAGGLFDNFRLNPSVFTDGSRNLVKLQPTADSLTMISILAAYATGQPITGTIVMIMSTLSDTIGELTNQKSRAFLQDSLQRQANLVHVVKGDEVHELPLKKVLKGDILRFYTGEKILVDGVITAGDALVDEASITGEFQAASKHPGDQVYASSIIMRGQVEIQAEKLGTETEEAAIYQLLAEAEENKSELQKTADRLAKKMVPISFAAAGLTYALTHNLTKAVGILVIDFVCGVKLSSEIAILSTMNRFTSDGVVIKGGQAIENAAQVAEVVFDKTGTLTTGRPVVTAIYPAPGFAADQLIQLAAYAEQHAHHPLSYAIVAEVEQRQINVPPLAIEDEEIINGYGIIAHNFQGQNVIIGSKKLMALEKVGDFSVCRAPEQENAIYLALDQAPVGVIIVSDEIRQAMPDTIQQLRSHGIQQITMLTGDKQTVAEKVGSAVQVDQVQSEMLPTDKVAYVKDVAQDHSVMMIGDGINDSAALKWSQVGVALGHQASDAAKSASDILIQSDQPEIISEIVKRSQQTMQVIEQNYRAVFGINGLAILLSFSGKINPIVSAVIHNGTTLAVILRSFIKLR